MGVFGDGNKAALKNAKEEARRMKFYDGVITMLDQMRDGKFPLHDLDEQKPKSNE